MKTTNFSNRRGSSNTTDPKISPSGSRSESPILMSVTSNATIPPIAQAQTQTKTENTKQTTTVKKSLKNRLRNKAISYGLIKQKDVPRVAAASQQASNIRATADAAASILAVTSGVVAVVSLGTAVPLSAGLLGLSILLQRVAQQVGLNIELKANLMIIQHEVDRFYKITKVMTMIAAENGFELNTGSVNAFVAKLTAFIAMLANDEVVRGIKDRQGSLRNPLQTKANKPLPTLPNSSVIDYSQVKGTIKGMMNRTLAPGEYLRQLVRDITILTVFMTMMIGEFDLFMRYVGNPDKKEWTKSEEFKSILFDTMRFAAIPPKSLTESEESFINRQKNRILKVTTIRGNPVKAKLNQYPEFYKPFSLREGDPMIQSLNNYKKAIIAQQETPKKKFLGIFGGSINEDLDAALASINAGIQASMEGLQSTALQEELKKNKQEEKNTVQAAVEEVATENAVKQILGPELQAAVQETTGKLTNQIVKTTTQNGGFKKTRKNKYRK